MEPYRPFVDYLVMTITDSGEDITELTVSIKKQLLQIPTIDIKIGGRQSPLMVAVGQTTASLYQCFEKSSRKIKYPEFT
jgi:CRISPR-associated protein Cas1